MDKLEEFLGISACDCYREWCQFFGGGIGEYGESFSRKQLEQELKDLENGEELVKKVRAHLTGLLDNSRNHG